MKKLIFILLILTSVLSAKSQDSIKKSIDFIFPDGRKRQIPIEEIDTMRFDDVKHNLVLWIYQKPDSIIGISCYKINRLFVDDSELTLNTIATSYMGGMSFTYKIDIIDSIAIKPQYSYTNIILKGLLLTTEESQEISDIHRGKNSYHSDTSVAPLEDFDTLQVGNGVYISSYSRYNSSCQPEWFVSKNYTILNNVFSNNDQSGDGTGSTLCENSVCLITLDTNTKNILSLDYNLYYEKSYQPGHYSSSSEDKSIKITARNLPYTELIDGTIYTKIDNSNFKDHLTYSNIVTKSYTSEYTTSIDKSRLLFFEFIDSAKIEIKIYK